MNGKNNPIPHSSIPSTAALRLPILKALADGAETPLSEVRSRVAAALGLNTEDLLKTNPGGKAPLFRVRIKHGTTKIKRVGLVEKGPSRRISTMESKCPTLTRPPLESIVKHHF